MSDACKKKYAEGRVENICIRNFIVAYKDNVESICLQDTVAENIDDYPESNAFGDLHVGSCEYFTVDQLVIDGIKNREVHGYVDESSFLHILVTKGSGVITNRDTVLSFKDGDSLFLPADSGDYVIRGTADILFTYEI